MVGGLLVAVAGVLEAGLKMAVGAGSCRVAKPGSPSLADQASAGSSASSNVAVLPCIASHRFIIFIRSPFVALAILICCQS